MKSVNPKWNESIILSIKCLVYTQTTILGYDCAIIWDCSVMGQYVWVYSVQSMYKYVLCYVDSQPLVHRLYQETFSILTSLKKKIIYRCTHASNDPTWK